MRLLYIDIDTLRPDHLGCYGYHRSTSPAIDALAAESVRFEQVHASDVPCLPSRSALHSGRFGIHNGVVNHGGTDADPTIDGADRQFWSRLHHESFPSRLKRTGMRTASVSSFAARHSAWHWHAGLDESYNVGKFGLETADEVWAIASDWLARHGRGEDWFLHVHLWDPHTPYRAPAAYGDPFADAPLPTWLTEEKRRAHWEGCGPHSAQECSGYAPKPEMSRFFPRQPQQIADMDDVRRMFDGYDTGVRMADDCVGRLLGLLTELGIDADTAVMLSSDHGETLGELNVYGDHQTADALTTRVPMLLRWPGLEPSARAGLHYQIDITATILELLGTDVPSRWHGRSLAEALRTGAPAGRDSLVVSQAAWACQRGVRFEDFIYVESRHDAYHLYDDPMLFDLASDPHEERNLAQERPDLVGRGAGILSDWLDEYLPGAARGRDPHANVMDEGGPFHVRGQLPAYLARLRDTGRAARAAELERRFDV